MFDFSKEEYDELVENCGFTDEELAVLTFKRRGWSHIAIAAELYTSESTIKRRCKSIKKKIYRHISKNVTCK